MASLQGLATDSRPDRWTKTSKVIIYDDFEALSERMDWMVLSAEAPGRNHGYSEGDIHKLRSIGWVLGR